MDPLFPETPPDLAGLSDEELVALEGEFRSAVQLIAEGDRDFLGEREADDIIAQLDAGVETVESIVAERDSRALAAENFETRVAEAAARIAPQSEDEPAAVEDPTAPEEDDGAVVEAPAEVVAEEEPETVEEPVLVTASAEPEEQKPEATLRLRRPPAPRAERIPSEPEPHGTALVAAGEMSLSFREPLTEDTLAQLVGDTMHHHGPMPKMDPEGKYRFGGPEHKIARAEFEFPDERTLTQDFERNMEKIRALGNPFYGKSGRDALVASGGLCAPATPFYSMPNFASEAEPVWDALPTFRADRGGVNVPTPTTIGDITTAISHITAANDALGGTFATKSCQSLVCPSYTQTNVDIIAHCREYGNLVNISWPEKIAHENALTMAALARTSEQFMLDRIKALSVNVTQGADTLGALIYLVDAIVKARFGIIGRLRMDPESRFRALIPNWVPDMLQLDTVSTQYDRYRSEEELVAYLRGLDIDPVFYMDTPTSGTSQLPDSSQTAAALDGLPANVQWAIYPEGAFLGLDMGVLELGIVRDSVLNATNDFQVFGERFRNVALIGPAQSAYWVTSNLCPTGQFPPAGTARTCE